MQKRISYSAAIYKTVSLFCNTRLAEVLTGINTIGLAATRVTVDRDHLCWLCTLTFDRDRDRVDSVGLAHARYFRARELYFTPDLLGGRP